MRARMILVALLLAFSGGQVLANTRYVDINNPAPVAPYTTWGTAATNIQDAVDAAAYDDTVLVADGTYHISEEIILTNCVALRSLNGSEAVTIDANGNCRGGAR